MTFEDKVKCSEIIGTGYLRKGKAYKGPKKRIMSLLFALIMAAYTILMCYLGYEKHKDQYSNFIDGFYLFMLVAPVFLAILKVIFNIIFVFIKNSIFSINHYKAYKFIKMLSDIDLMFILFFNIFNYYMFAGHDVNLRWDKDANIITNLANLFSKDNRDLFAFLITVIINLPALIHIIKFTFKNGGILYISIVISFLWPIFFIKYLHNTRADFYEYTSYDDNFYEVHHRLITKKHYRFGVNLTKFMFVALIVIACMFYGNFLPINISKLNYENYLIGMSIAWIIAGTLINYAYFYDLRQSIAIDNHAKKFYLTIDDIHAYEKRMRGEHEKQIFSDDYDDFGFFA